MNVKDFDIKIPDGDMLETIFNHQRDLMEKYHEIEQNVVGHEIPSGHCHYPKTYLYAGPLNLQDRACQLRLKDFAWRITEELTEATLALHEQDETHYLEEIIDALHFTVELMILGGITEDDLYGGSDRLHNAFRMSNVVLAQERRLRVPYVLAIYTFVEAIGEAMNRLKLKPWKSTPMLTDESEFKASMIRAFKLFIDVLKVSGFTARTATAMYLNKNAVNQFRQASNY